MIPLESSKPPTRRLDFGLASVFLWCRLKVCHCQILSSKVSSFRLILLYRVYSLPSPPTDPLLLVSAQRAPPAVTAIRHAAAPGHSSLRADEQPHRQSRPAAHLHHGGREVVPLAQGKSVTDQTGKNNPILLQ